MKKRTSVRMSKTDREFQKLESPMNYNSGSNKENIAGKNEREITAVG